MRKTNPELAEELLSRRQNEDIENYIRKDMGASDDVPITNFSNVTDAFVNSGMTDMMDKHLEKLAAQGMNDQQIIDHLMGGLTGKDSEVSADDIKVDDDVLNSFESMMEEMKMDKGFNDEFKQFSQQFGESLGIDPEMMKQMEASIQEESCTETEEEEVLEMDEFGNLTPSKRKKE